MPATERSFSAPPPARLYLDTDILIAYLVTTEPHHERCKTFLQRVAQRDATRIYVSSLSWMEFAHVVTRERFRRGLSEELRQRFQLDRWEEPQVRRAYLQALLGEFESLLGQFAWSEVFLTADVRAAATWYVAEYNLGTHDAVHVASAIGEGVPDFASLDEGYRRADGLFLWNDLIHTRQSA